MLHLPKKVRLWNLGTFTSLVLLCIRYSDEVAISGGMQQLSWIQKMEYLEDYRPWNLGTACKMQGDQLGRWISDRKGHFATTCDAVRWVEPSIHAWDKGSFIIWFFVFFPSSGFGKNGDETIAILHSRVGPSTAIEMCLVCVIMRYPIIGRCKYCRILIHIISYHYHVWFVFDSVWICMVWYVNV